MMEIDIIRISAMQLYIEGVRALKWWLPEGCAAPIDRYVEEIGQALLLEEIVVKLERDVMNFENKLIMKRIKYICKQLRDIDKSVRNRTGKCDIGYACIIEQLVEELRTMYHKDRNAIPKFVREVVRDLDAEHHVWPFSYALTLCEREKKSIFYLLCDKAGLYDRYIKREKVLFILTYLRCELLGDRLDIETVAEKSCFRAEHEKTSLILVDLRHALLGDHIREAASDSCSKTEEQTPCVEDTLTDPDEEFFQACSCVCKKSQVLCIR